MTISIRRWRRAATAILTMSIPLAAAACQATQSEGGGQLHAADSAPATPAAQARAQLEIRLAEVERQLADAKLAPEARRGVARERVVLLVALTELDRRIAAGEAAVDSEELVASARLRVADSPNLMQGAMATTASKPPRIITLAEEALADDDQDGDEFSSNWAKDGKPDSTVSPPDGNSSPAGEGPAGRKPGGHDPTDRPYLEGLKQRAADVVSGKDKEKQGRTDGGGGVHKARVESESRPRSLMTAVARQVGAMESCLGGLDSDVTLQVTVRLDAAGAIRVAKVDGVASAPASCVAGVLRRVRVRDHQGGTRVIRFPLYFQPD